MNDYKSKLTELFHNILPEVDASQINEETRLLQDLGIDSINIMLLAIVIEDEFKIHFEPGFMPSTVGDIYEYIETALKEQKT